MLTTIHADMVHNTIIPCLDNRTAQRIDSASFIDGYDDEYVEFWYKWGRYIRTVYNRRNTCHTFQ